MKHFIGEYYSYPTGHKVERSDYKYRLQYFFEETGIYFFECGHWVTDNVFMDLIRVKTGKQVYLDIQTELEI